MRNISWIPNFVMPGEDLSRRTRDTNIWQSENKILNVQINQ